jgi:beta-xylosidase
VLLGTAAAVTCACATAPSTTHPWVPDLGDGTFRNPILWADYSDPDVIRVGADYYLVASSFNATPALPILHSRDLVSWTIVGHALTNLPHPRFQEVQHGAGVWAPAIRQHGGRFYLFFPMPDEGIYVLTAGHPTGPWSEPRLLIAGKGLIDPCPFWDDDGKAYLVHAYARSRSGIKHVLRLRPMAPDTSRLLGEGQIVFSDPTRHPTLEGPKLFKRNGWYYILAPAGGVERGWQVALRSRQIYGPYADRIVLQQGRTPINGPHQGALVDTPGGEWWFLHFQDAGVYGRLVHLNPVVWEADWPLMGAAGEGGVREPVLRHRKPRLPAAPIVIPQTSDGFDGPRLAPQWQWHANHDRDWHSLTERPGHLRLRPQRMPAADDFSRVPNLLLQKFPAPSFTVSTVLELQGRALATRAGLIVMGRRHAALVVEGAGTERRLSLLVDNRIVHQRTVPAGPIRLEVAVARGGLCRFRYGPEGAPLHSINYAFQASKGVWIGAKVGLFAVIAGQAPAPAAAGADFSHFHFADHADDP